MGILKKETGESFPELLAAVHAGEVKAYNPGRYSKPIPGNPDERLRFPRGAWCDDDKAEIFADDLNAWLDANFPKTTWRFPVLATEPTPDTGKEGEGKPKQSEPQYSDNLKADWKQTAKEKAGVIYEREKKTGCDPSYASIAKTIEKEFAKEGVLTAKGKRLNADYILRHGLTGWKRPKT